MELSKPLILVADDEAESLRLLTSILRTEGYEVAASDSGDLALASAAAQTPDLILLDLRMPGMDGLEVCRRLKQSEATREPPLMFIGGTTDVEAMVEGLAVGAVDFVTKPFQRQELEQQTRPGERAAAIAAGSVLALLGFSRRGVSGALVAGVGGALIYHGLAKRLLPQQRS